MIRLINAYDIDYASYIRNENYTVRECLQAEKIIKQQPTMDAEPVRHGKWIFGSTLGHSWMKCSECCVSQDGQTLCFSYCPNCGAKMDGKREER
jgi:hypothetical protein